LNATRTIDDERRDRAAFAHDDQTDAMSAEGKTPSLERYPRAAHRVDYAAELNEDRVTGPRSYL
jgi:hypothetical protein